MMTVLLRGVNGLEEESMLDVALEQRADEVSEIFYDLIREVVGQAEALSQQLKAVGLLECFHAFVAKVRMLSQAHSSPV